MKIYKNFILVVIVYFFVVGCKKEEVYSSKMDNIAKKYNLSKTVNNLGVKTTKNFTTVEEFESFLKGRASTVVDSTTSKLEKSKLSPKKLSVEYDDAGDDEDASSKAENIFDFPQFRDAAFPDKVLVQYISPFNHSIYYSGSNFGTFSYAPSSGRTDITLGFRYHGIYTEIYSLAGVYYYYRNFEFTLDLLTMSDRYVAIAKYKEL